MKNLAYILLALLIASCSLPTAPDNEFEPYIVGNFKIVTPTEAEYIGEQSNQKIMAATGDTIEIKQPGQQSLKLWQDSSQMKGQFTMQFVDSTLSESKIESNNVTDVIFDNPKGDGSGSPYPIFKMGSSFFAGPDRIVYTPNMNIDCDSGFESKNPIIHINFVRSDDTIFRVYNIHVDGMIDAAKDVAC